MITRFSPYRELGDTTYEEWESRIARASGPLEFQSRESYNAARPHTRLLLGLSLTESSYGTDVRRNDPKYNKNPWSARVPSYENDHIPEGYLKFDSFADGAKHVIDRIITGDYWDRLGKPDPYRNVTTVAGLISVFSPREDGNDEELIVSRLVDVMNDYEQDGEPVSEITFGRVPHPKYVRRIVPKPSDGEGRGWDRVPHKRQPVSFVNHKTWGRNDTPQSIYDLFATGGERQYQALTDYVTGKDGTIWMLNDPRGDRAGWASGGGVGLPGGVEGDGVAWVAKYGASRINEITVSNENCGAFDEPLTEAQFRASVALDAYWQDQFETPWNTYPYNPKLGVVTDLVHLEFGTTGCPGEEFMNDIDRYQSAVRAMLKQYQTAASDAPQPPTPPTPRPEDEVVLPGLDYALAARLFGSIEGGRYKFDKNGPVSQAWLKRGVRTGVYPRLVEVWTYLDSPESRRRYFIFEDGWVVAALGNEPVRELILGQ